MAKLIQRCGDIVCVKSIIIIDIQNKITIYIYIKFYYLRDMLLHEVIIKIIMVIPTIYIISTI